MRFSPAFSENAKDRITADRRGASTFFDGANHASVFYHLSYSIPQQVSPLLQHFDHCAFKELLKCGFVGMHHMKSLRPYYPARRESLRLRLRDGPPPLVLWR